MRDIGILVWVVFLVVGVIGSMVSSIRRQAQAAQSQARNPASSAPSAPARRAVAYQVASPQEGFVRVLQSTLQQTSQPLPRPTAPRPPPAPKPPPAAPAPVHAAEPPHPPPGRRLFGNRRDLVRAVIAAEVLGKPRALRDE